MYTFVQPHVRSTAPLLYFIFFLLPPHVLFDHVRFNVVFKFIVFVDGRRGAGAPMLQPCLFGVKTAIRQHHNRHQKKHKRRHKKKRVEVQTSQTFNTQHRPSSTTHHKVPRSFSIHFGIHQTPVYLVTQIKYCIVLYEK